MRHYEVSLTGTDKEKGRAYGIYGIGYFPHKFRYKREAVHLQEKLNALGIVSEVKQKNG